MSIFAIIETVLRLLKLWDGLINYVDEKRIAEIEAARQKRDKAVDDQKNAKSEDDFDKAQSDISSNTP